MNVFFSNSRCISKQRGCCLLPKMSLSKLLIGEKDKLWRSLWYLLLFTQSSVFMEWHTGRKVVGFFNRYWRFFRYLHKAPLNVWACFICEAGGQFITSNWRYNSHNVDKLLLQDWPCKLCEMNATRCHTVMSVVACTYILIHMRRFMMTLCELTGNSKKYLQTFALMACCDVL